MKINDYKIGTNFFITCTKEHKKNFHNNKGEEYYSNFGIIPRLASMWAKKEEDVITVKATIIEEDVLINELLHDKNYDDNSIDYFGCVDFEEFYKDNQYNIQMIFPNIKQYFICFPYGPDSIRFWQTDLEPHKKGDRRGMTVRLKIEEI
jgi:hypothetical protein